MLKQLLGHYVTIYYTIMDIDVDTVEGVLENVEDDYIIVRRGNEKIYINLKVAAIFKVVDHGTHAQR